MIKLSTGQDSTYKSYIQLTTAVFGADSPALKFLTDRLAASGGDDNEEIIAPESQMIFLLNEIHHKGFN